MNNYHGGFLMDMDNEEYKRYILDTIIDTYPKYVREDILEQLIFKNIVSDKSSETSSFNTLDISNFPEEEKLLKSVELRKEAIKVIEEWEFVKGYKYSVLFEFINLPFDFASLIKQGKLNAFSQFDEQIEKLDDLPNIPIIYEKDNIIFLKFSFGYKVNDPNRDGSKLRLKYPVIVVFFKDINVMEIRFDRVKSIFKGTQSFYKNKISFAREWLERELNIEILDINLEPTIDAIVAAKPEEVVVNAKQMSLRTGGIATLEVALNKEDTLPLIGELQQLMKQHEEKFNEAKEVKQILETFIADMEETSDLPWIKLCWKFKRRTDDIIVKFSHRYMGECYTLLQHYGIQQDMERMNYVTRYLRSGQWVG